MLTLKLVWTRKGKQEHSIHECHEYLVQIRQSGRKVLTLDQNTDNPHELILDGQTVYAMNEEGRTIDVIRPEKGKPNEREEKVPTSARRASLRT